MRLSQFWTLINDEFGAAYASTVARDHVLSAVGGRTALEAIEAGGSPKQAARHAGVALAAFMAAVGVSPSSRTFVRIASTSDRSCCACSYAPQLCTEGVHRTAELSTVRLVNIALSAPRSSV